MDQDDDVQIFMQPELPLESAEELLSRIVTERTEPIEPSSGSDEPDPMNNVPGGLTIHNLRPMTPLASLFGISTGGGALPPYRYPGPIPPFAGAPAPRPEIGPRTLGDFARDIQNVNETRQSVLRRLAVDQDRYKRLLKDKERVSTCKDTFQHALQDLPMGFQSRDLMTAHSELVRALKKDADRWTAVNGPVMTDLSESISGMRENLTAMNLAVSRAIKDAREKDDVEDPGDPEDDDIPVTRMTCPVCFSNEVSVAAQPCGHTSCQRCAPDPYSTCAICRQPVLSTMRVYFSV